ncbi:MAG TPA: hypothetical protein VGL16_02035 [Actinomycetota bacterium]|jgi:gas vesicle protein
MKKFLIGMLIVGGVIAAVTIIMRRRSGSGVDDWDSLAEDSYSRVSQSASRAADAAKDSVSKATDAATNA